MTFATVTFLFGIGLFAFSGSEVQALTNAEFFNLVKPYISDLRIADEKIDDGNFDVIELPGGPDDELDVMHVFERLGLLEQPDDDTLKANTKEETSRRLKRLGLEGRCSCQKDRCTCCLSHQFSLLTYRFGLNACLEVAYLLQSTGFEVTITVNGHRLYHNRMELNRPPRLCYPLSFLSSVVKGCFEVYDIDLSTKKMCGRLTLEIGTWWKTYRWNYDLGCFRIPLLEGSKLDQIIFDPNSLTVDVVRNDLNKHNVRSGMVKARNVIELFRELQRGIQESQLEDVAAMPDLEPEL